MMAAEVQPQPHEASSKASSERLIHNWPAIADVYESPPDPFSVPCRCMILLGGRLAIQ